MVKGKRHWHYLKTKVLDRCIKYDTIITIAITDNIIPAHANAFLRLVCINPIIPKIKAANAINGGANSTQKNARRL